MILITLPLLLIVITPRLLIKPASPEASAVSRPDIVAGPFTAGRLAADIGRH